ncbi:MAG TPA: hypothetical protein VF071_04525 [Candidatus Limnocylindria bacterium]
MTAAGPRLVNARHAAHVSLEPSSSGREAVEAYAEEIRRRLGSDVFLAARLEGHLLRRLGVDPSTLSAAILGGLAGISFRLLVPLGVTAVTGRWVGIRWEAWVLIAILLGFADAWSLRRHVPIGLAGEPMRVEARRMLQDLTGLVPRIEHLADLRQLAAFVRRWYNIRASAAVAAAVAFTILLACLAVAPNSMAELPLGSVALLALLLYEFGELAFQNLYSVPFMTREARYDHGLFWPSPVDSVEVQGEMRAWATMQFMVGVGVTFSLVLAVLLVGPESPLVLPLAAGFIGWGYATTFASMVAVRAGVRTIVAKSRERNLAALQSRIDAYGPPFAERSPADAARVEHLIALHRAIREAPASPSASRTLIHTMVALVIPTAMFIVSVFGEVIAERLLDALLP